MAQGARGIFEHCGYRLPSQPISRWLPATVRYKETELSLSGFSSTVTTYTTCSSRLGPLPPGYFIYLRHLCGERFIEPVEGALVKERASFDFAVISCPFGIVETNQPLLRCQSVVDPLGVPRQRIALGPGQQRRTADLANHLLETVILGDLQVLGQGADPMHPEASLDNGPAKRWGLLDVLYERLQHLWVDVRELLQHVFREGREAALQSFEHVPHTGVGDAHGQAMLAARRARGQVAPEADPHDRDLLRVDLRTG